MATPPHLFAFDKTLNDRFRGLLGNAYHERVWPSSQERLRQLVKILANEGRANEEIRAAVEIFVAFWATAGGHRMDDGFSEVLARMADRADVPRGDRKKFLQWLQWGIHEITRADEVWIQLNFPAARGPSRAALRKWRFTLPRSRPSPRFGMPMKDLVYLQRRKQADEIIAEQYKILLEATFEAEGEARYGDTRDPEQS